jgi:uncharacterized protein (TIGR02996 family)
MTEREAFIAAIAANPADDTARLVYADWLQEHGETRRAEFIRRQIENARRRDGRTFIKANLAQPGVTWRQGHTIGGLAELQPWKLVSADHVSPMIVLAGGGWRKANYRLCVAWHRGFPAIVGCTPRQWHMNFHLFTGPIAALCFSASNSGVWGTWGTGSVKNWRSMVSRAVPVVSGSLTDADFNPTRAAFPNVQSVCGPCTAMLLTEMCVMLSQ